MKMQMIYRETDEKPGGRPIAMVAGFIQVLQDTLPVELINHFDLIDHDGRIDAIRPGNTFYAPREDHPAFVRTSSIDRLLTSRVWSLPLARGGLQLFCRQTRMPPSQADEEVLAVCGLMVIPPGVTLDYDHIHVFEGEDRLVGFKGYLGGDVNPDWDIPPIVEATRGSSVSQFFRQVWWGFGPEPVCLPSTMHLETNDKIDRYRALQGIEARSAAEEVEFKEIIEWMRPHGLAGYRMDPDFEAVLKILRKTHPAMVGQSSRPRTAAEEQAVSDAMTAGIKQMLDEREATHSPGMR